MMFSRRKFLQATSSIALLAGTPACGGINNPGSGAAAPSGPTGKTLISGFDNSGPSYAFANLVKMASTPVPDTANYAFPAVLDSNGYPNNAPSNSLPTNLRMVVRISPAWGNQQLVISWGGTGSIALLPAAISNLVITGAGVVNSSSLPTFLSVSGTNVRMTFNFTTAPDGAANYQLVFGAGTFTGMNNLVFCRATDEAAITANPNAFNPDFISQLTTLNPKIIRTMDWSGVFGHQSQFTQRCPAGAATFFADRFPPECWVGSATGTGTSGNPYICSLPSTWAGLVDGAAFSVQFTNANTAIQPLINVGSTGNVRMTDLGPNDLGVGAIAAGSIWTFVYSSVYNYWTGRQGGFQQKVPLEQHIALCNAVNAHLWYNICHRYSPSDGTALANVVKANLKSTLNFYAELSNEVWNFGNPQTSFIENVGLLCGFSPASSRGVQSGFGMYHRRMMGAITSAWGSSGAGSRLKRVMPFQAYGDQGTSGSNNIWRFQGQDLAPSGTHTGIGNSTYNAFTGSADYTQSPNRPIDYADVLSYATYYAGGQIQQFDPSYAPLAADLLSNPGLLSPHNITGISKQNPGVISYASDPGYITGARVNIQGVVGMTQVNQLNVTLTRLTATTYSMFTDSSLGTTVDTIGFTTYTSGGTSGLYPLVSGLTNAADQFAAGGGGIATALSFVDGDLRAGSQYLYGSNSVLSQNGTQSLLDLSTNIYPAWETIAASYDASRPGIGLALLTVEAYEGGQGGDGLSTATCTALGISTTYVTKIGNLITGYKNNVLFQTLVTDQFNQFLVPSHSKTPPWYGHPGPSPWSHFTGDTYTGPPFGTPYKSWDANVAFNH